MSDSAISDRFPDVSNPFSPGPRLPVFPLPLRLPGFPELLYDRFTSNDRTSMLARVLKGESRVAMIQFLGSPRNFLSSQGPLASPQAQLGALTKTGGT